jgi:hypothetical protein
MHGQSNLIMDWIAETPLRCLYPDGTSVAVTLRVGRPKPHKFGWACAVAAEGLRVWEGPNEIIGIDSWHALMLALRFLQEMLNREVDRGAVLYWPEETSAKTVQEMFCEGNIE